MCSLMLKIKPFNRTKKLIEILKKILSLPLNLCNKGKGNKDIAFKYSKAVLD